MKRSFLNGPIASLVFLSVILIFLSSCRKDEEYSLYTKTQSLSFDYDESSKSFGFSNISEDAITWTASSVSSFVIINKKQGSLQPGEQVDIPVNINRDLISKDSINTSVVISSSLGDNITMKLSIRNLPESKFRIDFGVQDALLANDQLYMLPNYYDEFNLAIYDLNTHSITKEQVGFTRYNLMALSPDENYMALVNNRDINIVDLNSLAIIDTYSFNESIHSIVYGPDEILYVFLSYSYNYLFHTINLDTKVTTPYDFNTSSYDSYDAILHPSQKYIYALEDDYSYNSFLKINISTGIPELSYTASFNDIDSPWWMCNNGQRFIFSDGEYMEVNAETAGIDFGDFQYIPIQGTSINELCYESSGNGYYINPKSTNSYYFDNQVRYYDAQFNLLETFFSEDYISTDNNNGVPGYQYIEGSIQKMFYDDSRQELILITKTRNNYYNSSNGIEIIKR